VVIQRSHYVVNPAYPKFVFGLSVRQNDKHEFGPFLLYLIQLRLNLGLPCGPPRNVFNHVFFVENPPFNQFLKGEHLSWIPIWVQRFEYNL
jgi:hypothetical protein